MAEYGFELVGDKYRCPECQELVLFQNPIAISPSLIRIDWVCANCNAKGWLNLYLNLLGSETTESYRSKIASRDAQIILLKQAIKKIETIIDAVMLGDDEQEKK